MLHLRFAQRLLLVQQIDVHQRADHAQGCALRIPTSLAASTEPAVLAGFHLQPVLDVERRLARAIVQVAAESGQAAFLVIGVQPGGPAVEYIGKLFDGFEAQQPAELRRPPEGILRVDRIPSDHLHVPEAIGKHLPSQFEPRDDDFVLVVPLQLIVNVAQRAGDPHRPALGIAQGLALGVEPAVAAVFHRQAILDLVWRVA